MAILLLRDYQLEMIDGGRAALRRARRVLLQAPTGAGKTALASFMAGETAAKGRQIFFVCHRAELVEGTSRTFAKFGIQHSFIAAGLPMDLRARVLICSIDTLKTRLHLVPRPYLVIWDECHHLGAAGWARVMEHYASAYHIGLSATPCRLDGAGLDAYFDTMVEGPSVAWLIEEGHLAPYRIFAPPPPGELLQVKLRGDDATGKQAGILDKPKLIGDVVTNWQKNAAGLRSVIFGATIAHSMHMAEQFNAAGIPAAHLDGNTPKGQRAGIIRDYAEGRLLVLTNRDLFGEGFDLAALAGRDVTVDCVAQVRRTNSLALHLQQQGRALRPAPGKVAIILDHAGNTQMHGFPDDEREWTLEGREKNTKNKDNGPPPPVTCDNCFMQIRRPLPDCCPSCGKRLLAKVREIEVADGELRELTASDKAAMRAQRKRELAEAKSLQELVALGVKHGYKSPMAWAQRQFAGRAHARKLYQTGQHPKINHK